MANVRGNRVGVGIGGLSAELWTGLCPEFAIRK